MNLAGASEVKFAPAAETDLVWYTLTVRQGEKELLRQTESLIIQGLLPAPPVARAGPA